MKSTSLLPSETTETSSTGKLASSNASSLTSASQDADVNDDALLDANFPVDDVSVVSDGSNEVDFMMDSSIPDTGTIRPEMMLTDGIIRDANPQNNLDASKLF